MTVAEIMWKRILRRITDPDAIEALISTGLTHAQALSYLNDQDQALLDDCPVVETNAQNRPG